MERRIKFIYGLTICAIATFSIVQGYWLYSRYRLSLEEYKSELYSTIIACAEEEMAIRNTLPHPPRFYGNRLRKTSEIKGDNVVETWRYEVFALDTLQYVPKGTDAHTYLLDYIASLHDSIPAELPKGLEYFVFTCDSKGHEDMGTSQLVEALNRFTVDHQHPFQKERLDSILQSRDIAAQSVTTTKADTMIWQPSMHGLYVADNHIALVLPYLLPGLSDTDHPQAKAHRGNPTGVSAHDDSRTETAYFDTEDVCFVYGQ